MKGDRERCLAAGMDRYVSKPVRPAELLEAMNAVVPESAGSSAEPAAAPPRDVFDSTTALAELDGDEQLLGEIAWIFLDEWLNWTKEGCSALAEGSASRLQIVAHTIKGAALSLGASGVLAAAARLETMGRTNTLNGAEEAWRVLEQAVDRLRPALTAIARPVKESPRSG
jgi:CheY-like chemotaxis protein